MVEAYFLKEKTEVSMQPEVCVPTKRHHTKMGKVGFYDMQEWKGERENRGPAQ